MRSSELAVGFCVGGFQRIHDWNVYSFLMVIKKFGFKATSFQCEYTGKKKNLQCVGKVFCRGFSVYGF